MTETPKVGDAVSWNSSGGKAHGTVIEKLTQPMAIKGHKVAASKENPELLVETKAGNLAAHKAEALTKE